MDEGAVNEAGYRFATDRLFSFDRVIVATGETSPVEVYAVMATTSRR